MDWQANELRSRSRRAPGNSAVGNEGWAFDQTSSPAMPRSCRPAMESVPGHPRILGARTGWHGPEEQRRVMGRARPDAARGTGNWTSGSSPLWIDRFAENEAVATEGGRVWSSNSLRDAGRRAAGPRARPARSRAPWARGTPECEPGQSCGPRWGASAAPTTTPWPKASSAARARTDRPAQLPERGRGAAGPV